MKSVVLERIKLLKSVKLDVRQIKMQCIRFECTAFLLIKYTLLKNDLNFQLFQVTIQQILHLYIV